MDLQAESRPLATDVHEALGWDPRIDATKINLEMEDGVVTVRGVVRSLRERAWCEQIVKQIRGVTAVRNELEVRLTIGDYRTDDTLLRVVSVLFEALAGFPDLPQITAKDGWITLRGSVRWRFQKQLAEGAVSDIAGVRGITNFLSVDRNDRLDRAARTMLDAALRRRLPDAAIRIRGRDARLILIGTVHTCAERDDAIELAWCAPGVVAVEDRLIVQP